MQLLQQENVQYCLLKIELNVKCTVNRPLGCVCVTSPALSAVRRRRIKERDWRKLATSTRHFLSWGNASMRCATNNRQSEFTLQSLLLIISFCGLFTVLLNIYSKLTQFNFVNFFLLVWESSRLHVRNLQVEEFQDKIFWKKCLKKDFTTKMRRK